MLKKIYQGIFKRAVKDDQEYFSIDSFRSRKLRQFGLVYYTCLIVVLVHFLIIEKYESVAVLCVVFVLMTGCFLWAKYKSLQTGVTLFLLMLTSACCFFMWRNEGIADESLLVFPGLLIFSAVIANFRLAIFLLFIMVCNVFAIGYVNDAGMYTNKALESNLNNAFLTNATLVLITFSVSLLAVQIHKLLLKLDEENKQVKQSQKEIQRLLNHDTLTGLPNRVLAKEFFNKQHAINSRQGSNTLIMFLDMDDFKSINENLGHAIGDDYLKALSVKLVQQISESDTVCRVAGDEFVIIAKHSTNEKSNLLAQKILDCLQEPIHLSSNLQDQINIAADPKLTSIHYTNQVTLSASIGIAVAPSDGSDFESLYNKADLAMYKAKESGRNNYCYYHADMASGNNKKLSIVQALRSALANNELSIHYQSKQLLDTAAITGAEALLRWHHPELGCVPPDEFIPLAERSGIICEIGDWVLEQSIMTCKHWQSLGFTELSISVNISAIQLKRGNFEQTVINALQKYQLEGRFLILELTESILLDMHGKLAESMHIIQSHNVRLAIDDFGTGYSNLGYLKKFNVSMLKIDRSFVSQIIECDHDYAIVKAIIDMSNSLNINTVAEGIETREIADKLSQLGCKIGQGYLWNKPMPNAEFIDVIKTNLS